MMGATSSINQNPPPKEGGKKQVSPWFLNLLLGIYFGFIEQVWNSIIDSFNVIKLGKLDFTVYLIVFLSPFTVIYATLSIRIKIY
jgi:hypothetical protein